MARPAEADLLHRLDRDRLVVDLDAAHAALRLAQHVVDEPLSKAIEIAAKIATRPRLGVQMSKELLNASIGAGGLREHLELELRSQVIGLLSADHRAAVLEFLGRKGKQ